MNMILSGIDCTFMNGWRRFLLCDKTSRISNFLNCLQLVIQGHLPFSVKPVCYHISAYKQYGSEKDVIINGLHCNNLVEEVSVPTYVRK